MSISMYQSNVNRVQSQIADIRKKLGQDINKKAKLMGEISSIERSITKNTSINTLQTKQRQITSKLNELAKIETRIADNEKKLADKSTELARHQKSLDAAVASQEKKKLEQERQRERQRKRQQEDALKRAKAVTAELNKHPSIIGPPSIGGPVSFRSGLVTERLAYPSDEREEETLEEKLQKAFPSCRPSTRNLFKQIVEEWHKYNVGEEYEYQEEIARKVGIAVSTFYQYLRVLRKAGILPSNSKVG